MRWAYRLAAPAVLVLAAFTACSSSGADDGAVDRNDGSIATPSSTDSVPEVPPPVIATPVRVVVPKVGIDAPIVPLGLNDDGTLQVPEDFDDAGWHTGGPEPGEPGPSVIAGHVDNDTGPAVFFHLKDLEAGDMIEVSGADGTTLAYEVETVEQYPKDDFPTERVYGSTPTSTLRLITCGGSFDESRQSYRENVVVFAHLASG